MKALEIKNINFKRKSDWLLKSKQVLFDVSFDVKEGEVFALLGTNGAGKTTTIKCILNLLRIKSGKIKIFENDYKEVKSKEKLAYLPENTYFYDNIKARESIILSAKLSDVKDLISATNRVIELLEIDHLMHKKMKDMSKGQKQRVSLAQALVANPKLLILDEPYSGLDPLGRKKFTEIFLDLKKSGTSILVSSHILSDIERIADRVGILKAGKLKGVFDMKKINEETNRKFELVIKSKEKELKINGEEAKVSGDYLNFIFSNQENANKALKEALSLNQEVINFGPAHGGLEELFVSLVKE
jgi:ABC-2 type transport system ATP-binding protein